MTNDTQSGEVERLRAAYLAGFNASSEGHNAKYRFQGGNENPQDNAAWCEQRDYDLLSVIKPQPPGRTDSERLDWLQANLATIEFRLREQWCVIISYGVFSRGPTLIQAIDAGMDSEKEAE